MPDQDVSRLTENFAESITKPLRLLIRRTTGARRLVPAPRQAQPLPASQCASHAPQLHACIIPSACSWLNVDVHACLGASAGFLGGDTKAVAKAAAALVVQGLCAALPAADQASEDARADMHRLCRMLQEQGCWTHLDALASGPCAAL